MTAPNPTPATEERAAIKEIARRLTKAQRKAVLSGHVGMDRGFWPLRNGLASKGLWPVTNPLGLAVKAILEGATHDPS